MTEPRCSFCGSNIKIRYSQIYENYLCEKHFMRIYHKGKLSKLLKVDFFIDLIEKIKEYMKDEVLPS